MMMRPLKRLYGATPAVEFGPLALQSLRNEYVRLGWSRPFVNAQVGRLRGMFRWAAAQELVPATLLASLKTVDGLRSGKTAAPDTLPVKPVPEADVMVTLSHVSPTIGAMIQLQLITGMRRRGSRADAGLRHRHDGLFVGLQTAQA